MIDKINKKHIIITEEIITSKKDEKLDNNKEIIKTIGFMVALTAMLGLIAEGVKAIAELLNNNKLGFFTLLALIMLSVIAYIGILIFTKKIKNPLKEPWTFH